MFLNAFFYCCSNICQPEFGRDLFGKSKEAEKKAGSLIDFFLFFFFFLKFW